MTQTVADVMTRNPATIERMAAVGSGDVVVLDNGKVCGILTDRDIAIRLVAEDKPGTTPVSEIVTDTELTTVSPDTPLDQAIQLKVPVIWMQEGVVHEKAAQKARGAGIFVIMDRCILKEHMRR